MKRNELLFKLGVALVTIVVVGSLMLYQNYTKEFNLGDNTVSIIIKPGDSLNKVIGDLLENKVVYSKLMLKYPARLRGIDKKLVPGRYDFTGANSCRSVLDRLEKGDYLRIKLTIPEGSTIWETSALIANKLELDSAVIHDFDKDSTFLEELNLPGLEGYLFPETYFIPWGTSEKDVVHLLVEMFHRQTDPLWAKEIDGQLTSYEILSLASIIEAETGAVDERTMVSSVYYNRLQRKMKLDADPTVIYGLGGLNRPLWRKDLRKDTPYNTYMHKGLPPTPINSPGLASIRAALNPEKSDYLYFVAGNDGKHIFSKTITEHNRAIRKIKDGKSN